MKRILAQLTLASAMALTVCQLAAAGQVPRIYMQCVTPAGNGPVLLRPAWWVGNTCWVPTRFGPIYGVFVAD